jgi:hypothetical protein
VFLLCVFLSFYVKSFNHLLLCLCYLQGLSLNRVELCLDNTIFTDGMAYTALSRARDLNSVRISRLQLDVFRANAEVVAFYSKPYAEQRAAWRAVNGM